MKKIIPIILVIILPLYFLLISVEINAFRLDFFEENFIENNTVKITNRPLDELLDISNDLLDYLKGEDIDLKKHFDEREVSHMKDVERLFYYGFIIKKALLGMLVLSIIYIGFDRKNLYKSLDIMYKGLYIWWIGILGIFILTFFDFTKYFTYFHLIFFNNDLWILDPDTSLMINMLPEIFFINIFRNIVLLFLIILFVLHFTIYILRKKFVKQ